MVSTSKPGKINVKLVLIVVVVIAVLGSGAFVARHVRRRVLAARSLEAGLAAFKRQEWRLACKHLHGYLSRRPDDVEILKKYAFAQLSVDSLERTNILGAISAYRRLMNLTPDDAAVYEKLVTLYLAIGDYDEVSYVARQRLERVPEDPKAPVWIAKTLVIQRKFPKAKETLLRLEKRLAQEQEKHLEYIQACTLLSLIASQRDTEEAWAEARKWADRAVQYDPKSPEAHLFRARLLRKRRAPTDAARKALLVAARRDLERAESLKPEDPSVRLVLSEEWMEHGELDRAAAVLESVKSVQAEIIRKYFVDPADWVIGRFLLAAKLADRRKAAAEGVALADQVLPTVKLPSRRVQVLPTAVHLYVVGQRVADARRCLDEYLELRSLLQPASGSRQRVALLKARVARAEDKPYRVIEILGAIAAADPSNALLWQVLAEAYSQTDQTRRAIKALLGYLKIKPKDPEMTLQLAREYIKQRDWNRAFQTARLAELDPTDIVIRLLRIETSVYVAIERSAERRKAWLKSLWDELVELRKEHPDELDIRLLQAYIAFHQGRVEDSIKELKLAVKECKETLRAELQLARVYFRTRRFDEAIKVCRDATEQHPAVALSWQALADLQRINKQNKEARATLEEGLKAAAGRWEKRALTLRLAIFHVLDGNRETGIGLLKGLAAKDKREIRARELLLGLPEVLQDEPVGQRLIDELREVQGEGGSQWRLHQASLYLRQAGWRAKQQEITALLQRCMESDPGWPVPALMLAQMHEQLGNLGHSEAACRRVLRANPTAVEVADRLVNLLERQARYAEAKEVLDKLEASPRILSARRIRVAIGSGDFAQAIDELKLRIANDEQNRDVGSRILVARLIYWQTGDVDEAFKYLGQAEAITGESMAVTAVRVEIVRAEAMREEEESRRMQEAGKHAEAKKLREEALKRRAEARRILDAQVARQKNFAAYLLRGSYLASIGEQESAEKDYLRLPSFKESRGKGYEFLGGFYVDTAKLDKAVAALEEGVKSYPNDLALKRRLMKALLVRNGKGDRQRGERILAELDERLPDDPDLLWTRARLLMAERTDEARDKAVPLLKRVVQLEPTAVSAHLALIAIALKKRDYVTARDLAIRAQGPNPASIAVTLARATAEQMLNNLPMATSLARMVLREIPDEPDARDIIIHAASTTRGADIIEEARALVSRGLKKKPDDPELLAKSASLYRVEGKLNEAGKQIDRAFQLAPENSTVLKERMSWLAEQKKYDEVAALIDAYEAKSARSKDTDVIRTAADILATSESESHRTKAMALYRRVADIEPEATAPRLGLAVLAYRDGDTGRAEKLLGEVLKLDPGNVQALNDLAWILQEARHDYEAALKLADKGVRLAPDSRHLRDTRGVILSHLPGRLPDARVDFQRCVELSPSDTPIRARALLQLGRTCARLNDSAAARGHLTEALQIDRKHKVFTAKERSEINQLLQKMARGGPSKVSPTVARQ